MAWHLICQALCWVNLQSHGQAKCQYLSPSESLRVLALPCEGHGSFCPRQVAMHELKERRDATRLQLSALLSLSLTSSGIMPVSHL